ncbi:Ca2+-binding RTX toxin-like protein [Nitrosomonas ureae]|uniref:calcium-binding protein n=1 Tax=Nitrosomonas ureae TaxID=44577 RepID=UPI000D75A869|nr:FG-GAP-like repeat-containing protein [Nitrosomonas ureae]PXX12815.1 Ca2+-binding RTX toxin-like protein [Nitrosomonas ureae]
MSNPVFQFTAVNPFGLGDVGSNANPILVDIDGDNDLDAFIGNAEGNILFYRNTGTASNPSFAAPSTNPFGLNDVGSMASPTFVDIDNDDDLDAFVGNNGGNMRFFRNEGTANNPVLVAAGINSFGLKDVGFRAGPAFSDIDNDGDLDAFIGSGINYNTWFFENTGTISNPIFAFVGIDLFGLTLGQPSFIDVDDDGDLDAFFDGVVTVLYRNIGTINDPKYYFDNYNPFGLSGDYSRNFADIDGDGDLDAFVGRSDGKTGFFQNIGLGYSPSFHPAEFYFRAFLANPVLVDIDDDGDFDVFVTEPGALHFYRNTGTVNSPVFGAAIDNPFGLSNTESFTDQAFVDIDGDGDFDTFSTSYDKIFFSRNIGTPDVPAFAAAVTNPFDFSSNGSAIEFADIDNDGDFDVFLSNSSGTQFFQNIGTAVNPAFAPAVTTPFGLSAGRSGLSFVDIDYDGDLDVFSGSTSFFLNMGTATNPMFSHFYGNRGLYGLLIEDNHDYYSNNTPVFVDIDGDGDFDAFVGRYSGVQYFVNNNAPNTFNLSTAEIYKPNTFLNLNNIVIEDPDSANVTAILTLSNVAAGSLSTGTSGTVTSIFDATTGVWSASGALADVNALLADVIFTPVPNFSGNFSIDTSVSDGVAAPLLGSKRFTVAVDAMLFSTPGNDNLMGTSSLNDTVSYENAAGPVTVSLNIATQQNTLGAGLDTLSQIEHLIGSDFADHLTGNAANNILQGRLGSDVLTGWSGADTLIGGPGNDSYFVEIAGDVVIEAFNEGIDSMNSSVTYTLPVNVENLTLRGASAINGTGNGQANTITGNAANNVLNGGAGNDNLQGAAGNDTLEGGTGRDTLDGGFGADNLKGGSGNDNYVVDNAGDSIVEAAGGGIDEVNSSVTYAIPDPVENLTLTGTSAINGTGNSQANQIIGNTGNNQLKAAAGNDILDGRQGADMLTGGIGNDIFRFTTMGQIDTITDFNVVNDTIQLENAVFTALTVTGTLAAARFRIGANALDANDNIIYNSTTGALIYDANGNGAGAAVQIATIGDGLALTNADIVVI